MAKEFTLNNFHPQAYLIFLDFHRSNLLSKSAMNAKPDQPAVHKLLGNYRPQSVVSKVYNSKDSTGKRLVKPNFFNLETYKISALIPELRFYKAQGDEYLPFYFPISTISDNAASAAGYSRTKGSGVTKFSVNFEGTDPYTAPKFLKADLEIFTDNLANLFDQVEGYAPLADLFTISIAGKGKQRKEINGSTVTSGDLVRPIEVAATLGYTIPESRMDIFTREEIQEIQESNLSLRMNVFQHNINVAQNGTVSISINYTARIDNTARDRIFSCTDAPEDILKNANIRQLFSAEEKEIDSTKKKKQDKSTASNRKSQLDKAVELRKILDILERTNRIHSVDTDDSSFLSYTDIGIESRLRAAADLDRVNGDSTFAQSTTEEGKLETKKAKNINELISEMDKSKRRVHYITFGDLLEAFFFKTLLGLIDANNILEKSNNIAGPFRVKSEQERKSLAASLGVTEKELDYLSALSQKSKSEKDNISKVIADSIKKLSTFRILLADVEYKHFTEFDEEDSVKRINLADVPISIETYQEFMFDKVINSYRNTYTIPQFLNDCVSSLLPKVFGQNWSNAGIASKIISAPPKFTSITYTAPELRSSLKRRAELRPSDIPGAQKNFRASSIKDEADYFIIYQATDRELSGDRNGNLDEDSRDGIYHFLIGKNRGLIKQISFSRFDVPYAQEQLMTNQVGLYDELKMPYTADILMVGNNLFMPGSQIFINPNNIGLGSPTDQNSPASRIGLGGYYTVIGVSTDFSGDSLTTNLQCSFGSHAKSSDGLTTTLPNDSILLGQIENNRPSYDAEPQEIPKVVTSNLQVSQTHYLDQLLSLKRPDTGQQVLDGPSARKIANDFVLNKNSKPDKIPGVLDRKINQNTGAARYFLQGELIIEIDDSRPTTQAVALITRRAVNGR